MSEYQYYEFQAVDRPLTEDDRRALRAISMRARITATSFTNHYEWGDFKGDPDEFMARWFDLHLHLTNWGTRRLMMSLPARILDSRRLRPFLRGVRGAALKAVGGKLILDIARDVTEAEPDYEEWDDGSGWLAAMAPLRADVLAGDLRLFHLLWLTGAEAGRVGADEREPLPGIGPMTARLEAFAGFFGIDSDLVQAAAERGGGGADGMSAEAVRRAIAAMPDQEKTELLARSFEGDPNAANALRAAVHGRLAAGAKVASTTTRTAGELLARARTLRSTRLRAEAERAAAERDRQAAEAAQHRRARLDAVARQGDTAWSEVEADIERRNAAGYDRAAARLADLGAVAEARGTSDDFRRRLRAIRARHASKRRFIDRLAPFG